MICRTMQPSPFPSNRPPPPPPFPLSALKGTLYDVTHLPCRSARYTPVEGGTCTPAQANQKDFPVRTTAPDRNLPEHHANPDPGPGLDPDHNPKPQGQAGGGDAGRERVQRSRLRCLVRHRRGSLAPGPCHVSYTALRCCVLVYVEGRGLCRWVHSRTCPGRLMGDEVPSARIVSSEPALVRL